MRIRDAVRNLVRLFVSLPPSAADIAAIVASLRFDSDGKTKKAFLADNKSQLLAMIDAVNRQLVKQYGSGARRVSQHDFWAILNCEAGLRGGLIDPDHCHSEGERGLLPLPDVIRAWNGPSAPAWDQPMPLAVNLVHYALYLGNIKNKGRGPYRELFGDSQFMGVPEKVARLVAGIVHGYFEEARYSSGQVPMARLRTGYRSELDLVTMLEGTGYVSMGALGGRQDNIEEAFGWMGPVQRDRRVVNTTTWLRASPDGNKIQVLLVGHEADVNGEPAPGWAQVVTVRDRKEGFVKTDDLDPVSSAPRARATVANAAEAPPALESFIARRFEYLPTLSHEIVASAQHGSDRYFVVNEVTARTGGQILLKVDANGATTELAADSVVFPLPSSLPLDVVQQLTSTAQAFVSRQRAVVRATSWQDSARETAPDYDGRSLNPILLHWAKAADGEFDTSVHEHGGDVACAWAINELAKLAFNSQPVGGMSSTYLLNEALHQKHVARKLESGEVLSGAIIMSPSLLYNNNPNHIRVHGHVGIVGGRPDEVAHDTTDIYSNSSRGGGVFEQNYTIASWRSDIAQRRGLKMVFYHLNPEVFSLPIATIWRVKSDVQLLDEHGVRVKWLFAGRDDLVKERERDDKSFVSVLPERRLKGYVLTNLLEQVPHESA